MNDKKKDRLQAASEKTLTIIIPRYNDFSQQEAEEGYIRVKPSVRDEAYSTARGDI